MSQLRRTWLLNQIVKIGEGKLYENGHPNKEKQMKKQGAPVGSKDDPMLHVHQKLLKSAGKCIIATENKTGNRYVYCAASGFHWFASLESSHSLTFNEEQAIAQMNQLRGKNSNSTSAKPFILYRNFENFNSESESINLDDFTLSLE